MGKGGGGLRLGLIQLCSISNPVFNLCAWRCQTGDTVLHLCLKSGNHDMAEGLLCHSRLQLDEEVQTKVGNGLKVAQRVEDRVTLLPLELPGCPVVVLVDVLSPQHPSLDLRLTLTQPHPGSLLLFVLDRRGLYRCFWQPSTKLLKM